MDLAFWTDIAVIFLAIETVVLLVVLMIPLYFIVRVLNVAHMKLPRLLFRAQDISRSVKERTNQVGDRIVGPMVQIQREVTKTETVVRELTPGVRSGSNQR